MKIAIKFGDNDFYNCFNGVLTLLLEASKWNDELTQDKDQLCKIINEVSYGCYLTFQNSFKYNEEANGELDESTKKYLQITPERILLNEEVDEYLKNTDWANGETFILDTTLYNNNIYTI